MKNFNLKITNPNRVEKKWGYELWIHNDEQYCGKLLVFNKKNDRFSMHYHMIKNETWYVQSGSFTFYWINTDVGKLNSRILNIGDVVYIEKGLPHQLIAMHDNSTIFEVSTTHFDNDSYRVYRIDPTELIEQHVN
jgi:mannose-6-phosphate isomerase-like protein (cupin superfamily)